MCILYLSAQEEVINACSLSYCMSAFVCVWSVPLLCSVCTCVYICVCVPVFILNMFTMNVCMCVCLCGHCGCLAFCALFVHFLPACVMFTTCQCVVYG